MIDDDPTVWPVKPRRRHQDHVEVFRSWRFVHPNSPNGNQYPEWRWRLIAGNGKIRAASSQGFNDRRRLVANLEASLHMTMLDQDRQLIGPAWYLYGVQVAYSIHNSWPVPGQVIAVPVIGIVIAVRTPDRHWTSRRKKP